MRSPSSSSFFSGWLFFLCRSRTGASESALMYAGRAAPSDVTSEELMAKRLYAAVLFSVVLGGSAAAQTPGIATGLTNPYGAVVLPGATRPSNAAPGSSSPTAGTSAGAGVGAVSAPSTTSASPLSRQSGSSSSSAPGVATGSNSAPAWLLCPPSGAAGMAPFLAGTNLSCAP